MEITFSETQKGCYHFSLEEVQHLNQEFGIDMRVFNRLRDITSLRYLCLGQPPWACFMYAQTCQCVS